MSPDRTSPDATQGSDADGTQVVYVVGLLEDLGARAKPERR